MYVFLLVVQVTLAVALIALILLQQGKGADAGAAFGSGASATVFGSRGAGNFMSRSSAVLATLFFANSLLLSTPFIMGSLKTESASVAEKIAPPVEEPAADKKLLTDLPDAPAAPSSTPFSDLPDAPAAPAPQAADKADAPAQENSKP